MVSIYNLIEHLENIGVKLQATANNVDYFIPETVEQAHPEVYELLNQLREYRQETIKLLQKRVFIVPDIKPIRAIMFWSEKLRDHFWWLIDNSALLEIQRDGVPIYDSEEIDIMLNAKDDQERKQLHAFKRIFGAKIYKAKGR